MTDLSLATTFTGAVILVWGWRALRNRKVNALFFKLRGRHSTWVFGFVSVIAGLLMLLSGLTAYNSLGAERVESFARSGLIVFGIGWALALIFEGMDRIIWRLNPRFAPADLQARRKRKQLAKRKRKKDALDWVEPGPGAVDEQAEQAQQGTQTGARLPD